jgi:hypothetical protein
MSIFERFKNGHGDSQPAIQKEFRLKNGENKNLEYKIKTIKLHTSRRSILMIISLEEEFILESSFSYLIF